MTRRRLALLTAALLVVPFGLTAAKISGATVDVPIVVAGSVLLGLLVLRWMVGLVLSKDREVAREHLLRQAGEALLEAADREQLYEVALSSLAALTDSNQCQMRVLVATGNADRLVVVSALGQGADSLVGKGFAVADLPPEASCSMLAGRPSLLKTGPLPELGPGPWDTSRRSTSLLVPLWGRDHCRGVFAVSASGPIGPELQRSVELLSGQVALVLERIDLTEEMPRRRSERRSRALVERSSELITVVGLDGLVSFVSPAIRIVLGVPEDEVLRQSPLDRVHVDDRERAVALLERTWAGRASNRIEVRLRHKDGSYRWFEVQAQNLTAEAEIEGVVIHAREVTDRKRAELRVLESEARFRSMVQRGSDVIIVLDDRLQCSYLSPSFFGLLGYRADSADKLSLSDLIHVDDVRHVAGLVHVPSPASSTVQGIELRLRHAAGRWVTFEATMNDLRQDPAVQGIVLSGRDVTGRKALEIELRHKAMHDGLTGLANRASFMERTTNALSRRPGRTVVGLIFVDLDDFKLINDGLGHSLGDAVLIETARRLRRCIRASDVPTRLGGDEFAVLVQEANDAEVVHRVAKRFLDTMSERMTLEGYDLRVGATVGVAVSDAALAAPISADELLRRADMAMYEAKSLGKGRILAFTPEIGSDASMGISLAYDITTAVERDELLVHYQPSIDLRSFTRSRESTTREDDRIVHGDEFSGLLGRAKAGDEQAFARLFRTFHPAVLRYLRVVAPNAAEDLAADSWLEVVRGLGRFSGDEDGFRVWVLTIVRHRHVDRLRLERRRALEVLVGEQLPEPDDAQCPIDGRATEHLSTAAGLRLISTLPPPQAEAIVLRSVVGLSVTEVAKLTDRTPEVVRVLVHRGLRSLAEQLSRAETDEAVTP